MVLSVAIQSELELSSTLFVAFCRAASRSARADEWVRQSFGLLMRRNAVASSEWAKIILGNAR
jgi:hypothetical protein